MTDELTLIVVKQGRLASPADTLGEDDDAGLDSLAVVNVMLAIEENFNVEFPDDLLNRRSFATIGTLRRIVASLQSAYA
jgi:acyl carrier protein